MLNRVCFELTKSSVNCQKSEITATTQRGCYNKLIWFLYLGASTFLSTNKTMQAKQMVKTQTAFRCPLGVWTCLIGPLNTSIDKIRITYIKAWITQIQHYAPQTTIPTTPAPLHRLNIFTLMQIQNLYKLILMSYRFHRTFIDLSLIPASLICSSSRWDGPRVSPQSDHNKAEVLYYYANVPLPYLLISQL